MWTADAWQQHNFPNPLAADLFLSLCGQPLGTGATRRTFVCAFDATLVVKVEDPLPGYERDYQNVTEWRVWQDCGPKTRKWLCPLVHISPSGKVLIAQRCEPCPKARLPKWQPEFLPDLHRQNWGLYQNKPVAMDYGRNKALELVTRNGGTLVPANWQDFGGSDGPR